jgi:hypothetical protein
MSWISKWGAWGREILGGRRRRRAEEWLGASRKIFWLKLLMITE